MSIADARRVIALEAVVAGIVEHNRLLTARVAILEDHLTDFQAAVEARQALDLSGATPTPSRPISALQRPPNALLSDAEACPSCVRRREQAQTRLRRHRAKIAAANGKTLPGATA